VTKLDYLLPRAVASAAVMATGDGLYGLLAPSTPIAKWTGYQLVSGCGNGLGSTIVSMILSHVLKLSSHVSTAYHCSSRCHGMEKYRPGEPS